MRILKTIFVTSFLMLGSLPFTEVARGFTCPPNATLSPSGYGCECHTQGAYWNQTTNTCACPAGYDSVRVGTSSAGLVQCRPVMNSEFYRNASTNYYPVCGVHRLPVDNNFQVSSVLSSGTPQGVTNSPSYSNGSNTFTYEYANGAPSVPPAPIYAFSGTNSCSCYQTTEETPLTNPQLQNAFVANKKRLRGDRLENFQNQTSAETEDYGPIAISQNPALNGRLGYLYALGLTGGSQPKPGSSCRCPNFNEYLEPGDGTFIGGRCRSRIIPSDPHRVLATFNEALHDAGTRSIVQNRDQEPQYHPSHRLVLDISAMTQTAGVTANYRRKIWTCMDPYRMSGSGNSYQCIYENVKNACDHGNGLDVPPSVVSNVILGSPASQQFDNVINKKLACCLNQFGVAGDPVKFDCAENQITSDFNALWASTDAQVDGGQRNAVILANAQGKLLTGFYTLNGARCEKYSEFGSGVLQREVVEPAGGIGQQVRATIGPVGSVIQRPPDDLTITGWNRLGPIPSTPEEKRRCPILVRAALVIRCPENDPSMPAQNVVDAAGVRHCSAAKNIQVHLRMEQIYEIAGQKPGKTFDSVMDRSQAGDISIDRIIAQKYGGLCPPGQVSDGDGGGCHY